MNLKKNIYIYLNHVAIHLTLTHNKSTVFQFKKICLYKYPFSSPKLALTPCFPPIIVFLFVHMQQL